MRAQNAPLNQLGEVGVDYSVYIVVAGMTLFVILSLLSLVWYMTPPAPVVQQVVEERVEENGIILPIGNSKGKKVGAKKAKKLAMKEAKSKEREVMLERQKEQKERDEIEYQERLVIKEEKFKEKKKKKKEEENAQKEEKEKQEDNEYQKMKKSFVILESGSLIEERERFRENIFDFIDYLKLNQVTYIEDLAIKFKMESNEIVDLLKQLLEDGQVSGYFDTGKFVYLSESLIEDLKIKLSIKGNVDISYIMNNKIMKE